MAPQRVLRCCSCHLFQVHQVKKSLKWTCKACGEKQSFLRAYGEGSGADCRRHVQKLNLLQGQASEMLFRSLEESVNANEEEHAGHQQTENVSLQETLQPTESRWLKYLEKGSKELEPEEGMYFSRPPSSKSEKPDSPFKNNGYTDLTGKVKQGSCLQNSEDWNTSEFTPPQWEPPRPAEQVKVASSKWEQFLLSSEKSSHVDTETPGPLQTGLRSADPAQPKPWTLSLGAGHPRRSPPVLQPPWASHTATRVGIACIKQPWDPKTYHTEGGPTVKVEQQPQPVLLCDLFKTGEDFDDDL
ncbi:PREDICTED: UPF0544 protein C5orf45 homolog [Elephantulus edwardii]|uniref:UPF0544 protein C5orf45 homolog n=1 Tax=Elephantulus edwardii TaxID=28737 RepID=UPI0003F06542|nr:PREDICTED: UPF0544 protein C5orf45 homolog [Elephantulus edwardii]